jgi:hypothetical protein
MTRNERHHERGHDAEHHRLHAMALASTVRLCSFRNSQSAPVASRYAGNQFDAGGLRHQRILWNVPSARRDQRVTPGLSRRLASA